MKQVQITGNLGRDAQHNTSNGNDFISFTVGVSEKWKNAQGEQQEKTDWFSVMTKQKSLLPYLKKGTKVFVQGKLSVGIYRNEKNNTNQVDLSVNALSIELLSSNAAGNGSTQAPAAQAQQSGAGAPDGSDDLPF